MTLDQRQWLKGSLDLAVVAAIGRGESYGYEILARLAEAGLEVGDASVYGTLKRLEERGALRSRLVASADGPARRYYERTASGEAWFRNARIRWRRWSASVEALMEER